jgi:hypothetical protein
MTRSMTRSVRVREILAVNDIGGGILAEKGNISQIRTWWECIWIPSEYYA